MAVQLLSGRARRIVVAACVPGLVVVGLVARFALPGAAADFAGGACYTALVYLLVAFAIPHAPPRTLGAAAFVVSVAVELFQLTGIPQDLADWWPPVRLALGTSFTAMDFPAYAVGALIAAALDRQLSPRLAAGARTSR